MFLEVDPGGGIETFQSMKSRLKRAGKWRAAAIAAAACWSMTAVSRAAETRVFHSTEGKPLTASVAGISGDVVT